MYCWWTCLCVSVVRKMYSIKSVKEYWLRFVQNAVRTFWSLVFGAHVTNSMEQGFCWSARNRWGDGEMCRLLWKSTSHCSVQKSWEGLYPWAAWIQSPPPFWISLICSYTVVSPACQDLPNGLLCSSFPSTICYWPLIFPHLLPVQRIFLRCTSVGYKVKCTVRFLFFGSLIWNRVMIVQAELCCCVTAFPTQPSP